MSSVESSLGRVHVKPHEGSIAIPDILTKGLGVCRSAIDSLGSLTREDVRSLPKDVPPANTLLTVPEGENPAAYFNSMSGRKGTCEFQTADGKKGIVNFDCRAIVLNPK